MPTAEVQVLTAQLAGQQSGLPDAASSSPAAPVPDMCGSYKEAKVLAAFRRREGTHAYAVYAVALERWCVR